MRCMEFEPMQCRVLMPCFTVIGDCLHNKHSGSGVHQNQIPPPSQFWWGWRVMQWTTTTKKNPSLSFPPLNQKGLYLLWCWLSSGATDKYSVGFTFQSSVDREGLVHTPCFLSLQQDKSPLLRRDKLLCCVERCFVKSRQIDRHTETPVLGVHTGSDCVTRSHTLAVSRCAWFPLLWCRSVCFY